MIRKGRRRGAERSRTQCSSRPLAQRLLSELLPMYNRSERPARSSGVEGVLGEELASVPVGDTLPTGEQGRRSTRGGHGALSTPQPTLRPPRPEPRGARPDRASSCFCLELTLSARSRHSLARWPTLLGREVFYFCD